MVVENTSIISRAQGQAHQRKRPCPTSLPPPANAYFVSLTAILYPRSCSLFLYATDLPHTNLMSFLGLRKWPTPVRVFSLSSNSHPKPTAYVGIFALVAFHDLWRFHYVSSFEGSRCRCQMFVLAFPNFASSDFFCILCIAPEWRNDARNPYAAKLAQSALH